MLLQCVTCFGVSLTIVLLLTPVIRRIALRKQLLDQPSIRKVHKQPTPLLGGISMFFGFLGALAVGREMIPTDRLPLALGLVLASVVVVVSGFIDDRYGMSPGIKLVGQLGATLILIGFGYRVLFISDPLFAMALTLFWMVGLINALNLLDNMDGITGGVAFIASCAFFVVALLAGQPWQALVAVSLAGAALAYLKFNFPPAKIFMGDAGSMLIGLVLATLGISSTWDEPSPAITAVPLLILAYPIFDTTLVTITRLTQGRRISLGGKDHSTHRIQHILLSNRHTVLVVYGFNVLLATLGVLLMLHLDFIHVMVALLSATLALFLLGLALSRVPVDHPPTPPQTKGEGDLASG